MIASRLSVLLSLLFLSMFVGGLAGCSDAAVPFAPTVQPPTPTPLVYIPFADVLRLGKNLTKASLVTVGYVYIDATGARLVDAVTFSAGATPQPLAPDASQIWIEARAAEALGGALRAAGAARLAVVIARGQLEGPGGYGPAARFPYRLNSAQLQPLAPQETSIAALLTNSVAYRNRYVRLVGALIAQGDSALLVERIGAGGVPEANARQVKVQSPLRDTALLQKLRATSDSAARFGQVQVEAIWRDGVLVPLAVLPAS